MLRTPICSGAYYTLQLSCERMNHAQAEGVGCVFGYKSGTIIVYSHYKPPAPV